MPVRIIAAIKRLPHISFEEFDAHWSASQFYRYHVLKVHFRGQIHGPLVEALPAVKSGLVKYKQFHVDPAANAALAARGLSIMPHDGIVEWEAETLDDIWALWGSDELIKTVLPDEKNFFERSSAQVIAGNWK
ncbi:hypothetical protein C8R43DRAFT_883139 [Mycena crocata]|nr:hypothetical protein C8R43DRAFT_883139 [Mycena crocata]